MKVGLRGSNSLGRFAMVNKALKTSEALLSSRVMHGALSSHIVLLLLKVGFKGGAKSENCEMGTGII